MKKIIGLMMIALLALSFVSCAKEEAAVASGPLTVAIWDSNQEPGLRQIMDDFTAETGVEVTIQVTPWAQYWTMLEAGATGGSLPDVFWMHSNEFAKYAQYDMLLDITGNIDDSSLVEMDKFPQDIVNLYAWEGKQLAVPKDIDTIALWYNKTMFDEAGIAYPDESWTWDTFYDAAVALTKDDGSQYGFSCKTSNDQSGWNNVVYSMGGEVINDAKTESGFDNPNTVKALDFMAKVAADAMPPYDVVSENNEEALFSSGNVAMVTMGSWMLAYLCNNEYVIEHGDIAVLPMDATTGRRVSIYNGLGWAAAGNTARPDDAWALIEYMGSRDAQQKQSDLGIVISAYEGTTENWVSAYPDFNLQAYLDMMDDIEFRPYSNNTVVWNGMTHEKLIDVWTGTRSAQEVAAEIHTEMNEILSQE